MSSIDLAIKNLVSCLQKLVSQDEFNSKDLENINDELLLKCHLEYNIKNTVQFLHEKPELHQVLSLYESSKCSRSDVYWDFVSFCLIILNALTDSLLKEECSNAELQSGNHLPKGILSISQETIVKKSFQFIFGLGVLPNLIPGLKTLYEKRTSVHKFINTLNVDRCPMIKYFQIICCASVFTHCLKQKCLEKILLSSHSADLFIPLFQICHAPLKIEEPEVSNNVSSNSEINTLHESEDFAYNLDTLLLKVKEPNMSQETFMKEMLTDRRHFMSILNHLLTHISPSIILWDLLLLQGIGLKTSKSYPQNSVRIPIWFQKICNKIITDHIVSPSGVKKFIAVVLDKLLNIDVNNKISTEKIDAVAKLIVMNHAKPSKSYLNHVSTQALELLSVKGTQMDDSFRLIAASIIVHLLEYHKNPAEEYILPQLFKPFVQALDLSNAGLLIPEEDINLSIENIHEIFINATPVLSQDLLQILLPFIHIFFFIYTKLLKGILIIIRTKLEQLLLAILNTCEDDYSLKLLQLVTYNDNSISCIHSINHLKWDLGLEVMTADFKPNIKDSLQDTDDKCQALLKITSKISNKKVKFDYFLSLLKKAIEKKEKSPSSEDVLIIGIFDEVYEDIVSDFDNGINLIVEIVIWSSQSKNNQIIDKLLESTVEILFILIESFKDNFKNEHWKLLKKCLPALKQFENKDSFMRTSIENAYIAIQTHGAVNSVCENKSKLKIEKMSPYSIALKNVKDEIISTRGGGLLKFCQLLEARDPETLAHLEDLLLIFQENLLHDDSYIYLTAIRGLSLIGNLNVEKVLPILIPELENACNDDKIELKLKIGEVFLKICQNLGELTVKYRNALLSIFLAATRHDDALIRASGIANLGELCKNLKLAVTPVLQEVLNCVTSSLKYDSDVEVRRAAALSLSLVISGVSNDMLLVFEHNIKDVYLLLREKLEIEKDDRVKLHCQLALEEINCIMNKELERTQQLTKEIRICDPF